MKNVLMMELKMNRHINMKNYFMLLTVFIFTDFLHASISELQGNFLQQMPNFNSISFDFSYTQEIKEYGINNKVTETSFYILGELKAFLNSLDYFYRTDVYQLHEEMCKFNYTTIELVKDGTTLTASIYPNNKFIEKKRDVKNFSFTSKNSMSEATIINRVDPIIPQIFSILGSFSASDGRHLISYAEMIRKQLKIEKLTFNKESNNYCLSFGHMIAYFDAKSMLLNKLEIIVPESPSKYLFSDYIKINGVYMPCELTIDRGRGDGNISSIVHYKIKKDSIKINSLSAASISFPLPDGCLLTDYIDNKTYVISPLKDNKTIKKKEEIITNILNECLQKANSQKDDTNSISIP